jgi:hypothetical protein
MHVHARLNVIDNAVLCPRTCRWEAVDHCMLCRELAAIEQRGDRNEVVDCHPQVSSLARTVERLSHAG